MKCVFCVISNTTSSTLMSSEFLCFLLNGYTYTILHILIPLSKFISRVLYLGSQQKQMTHMNRQSEKA